MTSIPLLAFIRVHLRFIRGSLSPPPIDQPNSSSRRSWLTTERVALAGLLLFAVVVRGGVLFAMREKLRDDPDAYRRDCGELAGGWCVLDG